MFQMSDSGISLRVRMCLPAGTNGPIAASICFHLVRRMRIYLSASQNSSGEISRLYWKTIRFAAKESLYRFEVT